jgi:hypothetical protein
MEIDEKRVNCLTKFSNKRGDKTNKKSDHNLMLLVIRSNWNTMVQEKGERIEIYNYKNKDDFENFQRVTEENADLDNCFNDEEDLNIAADRWLNIVNGIVQKCFRRIRIKQNKSNKELEDLFKKKEVLEKALTDAEEDEEKIEKLSEDLNNVLDEISEMCSKKNKDTAKEYLSVINDPLKGFNIAKTWNLKKKLAPKNQSEPPMAKKDANGSLVTDKKQLENLYI